VSAVANTDHAASDRSAEAERKHIPDWLILLLTCSGQFMVILDASIVNIALPSIRGGLGFTATGLQWVVNAYLLTFGGFLLLGGRTADLFGRRRMLITGLFLFSAASLACGLAPTPGVLVAARAAQGLGAAVLAPAVLAVLTTTFTEARARARALSIWTAVGAVGGVLGSVLGGAVTAALSWHWIFLINVPICAAMIAVATVALVGRHERGADGLDISGAVSVTIGMALLIYGIVQTDSYGWGSSRVLVPLTTGLVLIAVFVLIEGQLAARPMLPLRLLRSGAVSGGLVLLILVGAISMAIWYFASLFFQNVMGYSPIRAGLALTPAAASLVATATSVSVLLPRTGPRPLVAAGCLCHIVGFSWFAQASPASSYAADLLGPTMLIAVGIGLIFTPTTVAVTSRVTRSDAGIVSGLANASRQLGGSVGLAALATAASTRTRTLLGGHHDGQVAALATGYDRVFLIAAGVAVVTALVSPVLPRKADMKQPAQAPGPAARRSN
jgi:EmrB/QacA subfamily drug resistance transporter